MAFTEKRAFELIQAAHERSRMAHAFLISGPRGSGKKSLAAQVIQMLEKKEEPEEPQDSGLDLFGNPTAATPAPTDEPAASLDDLEGEWTRLVRPQSKSRRITIDDIRDLEHLFHLKSGPDVWKVGVIIDADRLGQEAENAFLKTLEEPPPRSLLMLLSSNPGSLLPTILSRCIHLTLLPKELRLDEVETEWLGEINNAAREGFGNAIIALNLQAAFSNLLNEIRSNTLSESGAILKAETQHYKDVVEGDWLKNRDKELKAVAETDYLFRRDSLLDLLHSWLMDVLRRKAGGKKLDLPQLQRVTAKIAEQEELSSLLYRIDALQEMKSTLNTNAHEQLTLEVGFLEIFG